jgi:hypothetical protein
MTRALEATEPMPTMSRDGATPVGGENGGRHTVRLRGGRAGSVTQESLVVFGASYHPVNRTQRLSGQPLCCRTAGPSVESPGQLHAFFWAESFVAFAHHCVVNKISACLGGFLTGTSRSSRPVTARDKHQAGLLLRHGSPPIDSDNESITLGGFPKPSKPSRKKARTAGPYTAARYPRATSRGRRAVAGE